MRHVHFVFLAIGIAFLVIGITGQKAFIPIGFVFIVLGALRMQRSRG